MAKDEFVLFISHEAKLDGTGRYSSSYRLARLIDVEKKHITMFEMLEHNQQNWNNRMGSCSERAEAYGFMYADVDEVVDEEDFDEEIERGRLEAKRIFISITAKFPFAFLNGNETHVISNMYETAIT